VKISMMLRVVVRHLSLFLVVVACSRVPYPGTPMLAPGGEPYFPKDDRSTSSNRPRLTDLYSWFLWRMGEPSLSKGEDEGISAYRLLVIPAFDQPFVIRISQSVRGTSAVARSLKGRGLIYDTLGGIDADSTFFLSADDWRIIDSAATASAFWTIPTEYHPASLDATNIVIEGRRGAIYHTVATSTFLQADDPIMKLVGVFLERSRIPATLR
jgi:hypothetical protein